LIKVLFKINKTKIERTRESKGTQVIAGAEVPPFSH